MKALVFDGPGSLSVREREVPDPGPGEVLVRVEAAGICGSDLHGYTGKTGRRHPGQVMGHEFVARVEAFGPDTDPDGLAHGQLVAIHPTLSCGVCPACLRGADNLCATVRFIGVEGDLLGGFAEYTTVPARNLVPLSPDMPVRLGALVEPLAVSYRGVLRSGVEAGQGLLVLGAGMIGLAAVIAGRRLGCDPVIVSEPSANRRAVAERLGAIAVDPLAEDLVTRVQQLVPGGVPAVVDCVGLSATLTAGIQACAPEGTVVLIGMESPALEFPTYALITRERHLLGCMGYRSRHFRETAAWVSTTPPELIDFIDDEVGFADVVSRFDALASGRDTAVKVVLRPGA